MLSGRAALEHPQINELAVCPQPVVVRNAAASTSGTLRTRVNAMSELQRRVLRLRRNGTFRRRRSG